MNDRPGVVDLVRELVLAYRGWKRRRERAAPTAAAVQERLLTKKEMARDLGMSTRTLDRRAKQGLIPFEEIRINGNGATARRYKRSAVRGALGLPVS